MSNQNLILSGLSGSNPLGFMAALGCLRVAARDTPARLGWIFDGQWRPCIHGFESRENLLDTLDRARPESNGSADLSRELGSNITVPRTVFRDFAKRASQSTDWSPFAAAFGCDMLEDDKERIQYTRLCFITGSGHQNFLDTIRQLREKVTIQHLRRALFESMEPLDRGLSMRWDPADAKEYALQWANPGPEGVQSCWGAYRLAIEALPFFPAVPTRGGLETTAFAGEEFRWPIWSGTLGPGAIRLLLANGSVKEGRSRGLARLGIEELFAAQRVRIGEGANFKVSFRPARPVRVE